MPLSGELLQRLDAVNFPAPPAVVMNLSALLARDDVTAREVAAEIESDATLAAGLLRLANSVALGGCRDVATVEEAVVRVGAEEVRDVVIALATVGALRPAHFDYEPYWRHSLAVAQLAASLQARSLHLGGRFPEAYTAGLLHDLGMLVLDRVFGRRYRDVRAAAEAGEGALLALERERLGIDHAQAGGRVLAVWQFPEALVDAAERHHAPEGSTSGVTHLVHLAEAVFQRHAPAYFPGPEDPGSWDLLGVAEAEGAAMAADVAAALARADDILRAAG